MIKILWPWSKEAKEFKEYKLLKSKEQVKKNENFSTQSLTNIDYPNTEYLFDFLNWSSSYGTYYNRGIRLEENLTITPEEAKKIKVKPVDVVTQLHCAPQNFLDVSLIDEKIEMFKEKEELINNSYSKDELQGFIERLEHRRKYPENREYFEGYQTTTDEKIGELLDKYPELVRKPVELFIPDFPKEAINKMKSYTAKVKDITGKKPIYYVIAESDKFKKAYDKRDPILLAQSPFGFYWYILGAWDKEMVCLSEL